jgi:hypothetical protein
MPIRIKGLTINLRSWIGRTFPLQAFNLGLVLSLLLLLGIIVYHYQAKIPKIDWRFLLGKLAIERPTEKIEVPQVKEKAEKEKFVTTPAKVYEETAHSGEGITHLARRALKRYLQENPQDFELTPEHKIYIEDYIQKKTGSGWLRLGQTLTFSEELIIEAINKARQLTPNQLENLKQYSQLVPSL